MDTKRADLEAVVRFIRLKLSPTSRQLFDQFTDRERLDIARQAIESGILSPEMTV